MPTPSEADPSGTRRDFLRNGLRLAAMTTVGGVVGAMASRLMADDLVWQLDPAKCLRCGLCATDCVLPMSAVKCVQSFSICGYCDLCTGYFVPEPSGLNTGAENQLCPTDALKRRFIEDPYFEYTVDEDLCIGCAKCVEGCVRFGNGSLYLQVNQERCLNCNECSIARVCPADAFRRVPAKHPYLLKTTVSH